MNLTLDANVWLAAMSPAEREHHQCAQLLDRIRQASVQLHQPALFAIEVCASVARRTRDRTLALAAGEAALAIPGLSVYELDHSLAVRAGDVAATCALRGADAVYVATARLAQCTLLTLDAEVLDRAGALISVMTPATWMQQYIQ